jgi:GST-like protein
MWQMGSAPFIGGGFGHFYVYAPERYKYPIDRYAMETKRLFAVADMQLAKTEYLAGADYTIADIAAYTWLGNLYHGAYNGSDKFLSLHEYENVGRWVTAIDARPGAIRGRLVNTQAMAERHSAADFDAIEDRSLFEPVRKRADV